MQLRFGFRLTRFALASFAYASVSFAGVQTEARNASEIIALSDSGEGMADRVKDSRFPIEMSADTLGKVPTFSRILNPQDFPLSETDARASDYLGTELAASGDRLLAGAAFGSLANGTNPGKAYSFIRSADGWQLESMLTAQDGANGDRFGSDLDIDNDLAVVCADGRDPTSGVHAGAAYVFTRQSGAWQQEARLTRPQTTYSELFCSDVKIHEGQLLIGTRLLDNTADPVTGAVVVYERLGDAWQLVEEVYPSVAQGYDGFGASLSVEGDLMAVGAPYRRNAQGVRTGAVQTFRRTESGWVFEDELFGTGGTANGSFGFTVDVSGSDIVVAAPLATAVGKAEAGIVYFFNHDGAGWEQVASFLGEQAFGRFGETAALDGNVAFLAPVSSGGHSAAVLISRSDGVWQRSGQLAASDAITTENSPSEAADGFGRSIVSHSGYLFVGASFARSSNPQSSGAVYVFEQVTETTWRQSEKLRAGDAAYKDRFGGALAGSQSTLIVGADLDDTRQGRDTGSASVYEVDSNGWVLQARLMANDAEGGERFGSGVAIDGDIAVVGAPYDNTVFGQHAGSVYVFERTSDAWQQVAKLLPSEGSREDYFGRSVAISGSTIAVGVPLRDQSDEGVIFVFERSGSTWHQVARLVSPLPKVGSYLGSRLSISGDNILASVDDYPFPGNPMAEAVVAYSRTPMGWLWLSTLEPPAEVPNAFGSSPYVLVKGNQALVGYSQSKLVVSYERVADGWVAVDSISPPEPVIRFGITVSADTNYLVVGSEDKFYAYERQAGHWSFKHYASDLDILDFGASAIVNGQAICGFLDRASEVTGLAQVGIVTTSILPVVFADGFE